MTHLSHLETSSSSIHSFPSLNVDTWKTKFDLVKFSLSGRNNIGAAKCNVKNLHASSSVVEQSHTCSTPFFDGFCVAMANINWNLVITVDMLKLSETPFWMVNFRQLKSPRFQMEIFYFFQPIILHGRNVHLCTYHSK